MITKEDLHEAIAECQGERNPNANTCIKLAAYYTILDHITERAQEPGYSYNPGTSNKIQMESESEFAIAVSGLSVEDVMPVMDELMDTIRILNPGLYNGVMRKIGSL